MVPLPIRLSLFAVALLALAAWLLAPRALWAGRSLAATDDPVALTDLALEQRLDARGAESEIAAALASGDIELAESFLALARERGLSIEPALADRVAAEAAGAAAALRSAGGFVRGLVIGEPDDLASFAGTATGDLFVFGDARDAVREGVRLARGEQADELVLGLACVGLAVTAGTYASLGAGMPARMGVSLIKAARRTGRMGARFSGTVGRAVMQSVDLAALKQAFAGASLLRPVAAVRAAREAVKLERAGRLVDLAGDIGRVQTKAGTRAALDGLKLVENPQDAARLARLAQAKGAKTRAILKLLGRGAIVLTSGIFTLANWVFWALVDLLMLCAMIKRSAERVAMHIIARRKARRAAVRAGGLAAPARSV
jgi:hypothetical protein